MNRRQFLGAVASGLVTSVLPRALTQWPELPAEPEAFSISEYYKEQGEAFADGLRLGLEMRPINVTVRNVRLSTDGKNWIDVVDCTKCEIMVNTGPTKSYQGIAGGIKVPKIEPIKFKVDLV